MPETDVYSVSQVAAMVQAGINHMPALSRLWMRGEIYNFKKHSSGHLYFSIKDTQSAIRAVMFKGSAGTLPFLPKDGMDCLFQGRVSLYAKEVQVQFYAEDIVPAGAGLENLALEALKQKLAGWGYFEVHRKKPLPFLPEGIGVVTSPTGAVIEDICQVVWRRYPGMPIYLYPAVVQGEQASVSLSEGLDFLSSRPEVDVIILARGGGSAQDLTAFNTEAVATAIFHCSKPVISAVGHETDVTIADMAADVRAATPSVAAELAVPQLEELTLRLNKEKQRLYQAMKAFINRMEALFARLKNSAVLVNASKWWLTPKFDHLLHLDANLHKAMDEALTRARHRLALKSGQLQALSPLATLSRGYAVCMDEAGRVILRAGQVEIGDDLQVRLSSGRIGCRVLTREDEYDSKDDI